MDVLEARVINAEVREPAFRKDLENFAYSEWRNADILNKEHLLSCLRDLLTAHASAVMFAVLRRNEPNIVVEAVDKVVENLDSFREEALFTTWAHRIFLRTMYDQRRLDRSRKETPFEEMKQQLENEGIDTLAAVDMLMTIEKILSAADYAVFEQIAVMGRTVPEAADELRINRITCWRKWERIKGTLKDVFTK